MGKEITVNKTDLVRAFSLWNELESKGGCDDEPSKSVLLSKEHAEGQADALIDFLNLVKK